MHAMENDLTGGELPRVAADRSAYIRSVKEKLAQKRAAFELVKRKVNVAVAAGRVAEGRSASRRTPGRRLSVDGRELAYALEFPALRRLGRFTVQDRHCPGRAIEIG